MLCRVASLDCRKAVLMVLSAASILPALALDRLNEMECCAPALSGALMATVWLLPPTEIPVKFRKPLVETPWASRLGGVDTVHEGGGEAEARGGGAVCVQPEVGSIPGTDRDLAADVDRPDIGRAG